MDVIIQLISSVGFPIVACFYLAHMNDKQDERHIEQEKLLVATITENTNAIRELKDKLN